MMDRLRGAIFLACNPAPLIVVACAVLLLTNFTMEAHGWLVHDLVGINDGMGDAAVQQEEEEEEDAQGPVPAPGADGDGAALEEEEDDGHVHDAVLDAQGRRVFWIISTPFGIGWVTPSALSDKAPGAGAGAGAGAGPGLPDVPVAVPGVSAVSPAVPAPARPTWRLLLLVLMGIVSVELIIMDIMQVITT